MTDAERYRVALLDWLACATRGRSERAAQAAAAAGDGLLDRVAAAGAAGHVLDFDDTWTPGLAHLSAATAPAALVAGADAGAPVAAVLSAYAAGFEAMAALARASHPALYDARRHPTAICGTVGAAVATARVLRAGEDVEDAAAGLALLSAGGLLAAFGSDGKALQVGMAASTGVQAARLAAAGARVHADALERYAEALGAAWAHPATELAVRTNWIKAYPCCLQAHTAIEAALEVAAAGAALEVAAGAALEVAAPEAAMRPGAAGALPALEPITVVVHPLARQAAAVEDPRDGLQAKFSLPYLVAFALLRGAPGVDDFAAVDPEVRRVAAERVRVAVDASLGEQEAVLLAGGREAARVTAALGSPQRPMSADQLAAKVSGLAGDRLDGVLDDPDRPAADVLVAAGLA